MTTMDGREEVRRPYDMARLLHAVFRSFRNDPNRLTPRLRARLAAALAVVEDMDDEASVKAPGPVTDAIYSARKLRLPAE